MESEFKNNLNFLSDAVYKNFEQLAHAQYQSIVDHSTQHKLTDAPHEIIIDVTATVMEENNKGEIVGTKEVCTKTYHIPVPITQSYELYMSTFFEHLQKCLETSTQTANTKVNNNE
jgi:hypothetical protein